MNDEQRQQLTHWVEQYLDDALDESQFAQLQQLLTQQSEARELYLDLMQQNTHLQLQRTHLPAISQPALENADDAVDRRSGSVTWMPAIAVLAASLLFAIWWNVSARSSPGNDIVAQIVDASDAEWGDCTLPTAGGSMLSLGRLDLKRGLATIRFRSGAEVTLESPATLEIQSTMTGHLIAGTAVVEVPDSAHGFTISTPTAIAIDHGTAFAVTVDQESDASSIEVLEGDVEVQHVGSDASRRLKTQERVIASTNGLSDSLTGNGEVELAIGTSENYLGNVHRITTADGQGRDATVCRSDDKDVAKNSRSELVLIKNPFGGFERFSRKGYFAFDLSAVNGKAISDAKFVLTLQPSGLGFASKVNDCEFLVYGMTYEALDSWDAEQLNWNVAPANAEGATGVSVNQTQELGRFVVPRGKQYGRVSIEGQTLVNFLAADTNKIVTLIVVRSTSEGEPGGLVHGFANRHNSTSAAPSLIITTER